MIAFFYEIWLRDSIGTVCVISYWKIAISVYSFIWAYTVSEFLQRRKLLWAPQRGTLYVLRFYWGYILCEHMLIRYYRGFMWQKSEYINQEVLERPKCNRCEHWWFVLTLSLLGYLKTRIRWGGGQFGPPPLNPMFDVKIIQMIHHWKYLVLYL